MSTIILIISGIMSMRMPISRPAEIIPIIISGCSVDEGPVEPTRERERERERKEEKIKGG